MDYGPQIPRGPEALDCPFHRKPMSEVCHKCPLWVQLRGKDPQSESEIDKWNCSLAWMPRLTIENTQMAHQTGAAVETFRNQSAKQNNALLMLATGGVPNELPIIDVTPTQPSRMIEGK
jgi:hypothetical protein